MPENGCQNQWTLNSQTNLYLEETSLPSFSDLWDPTLEVSCPLVYGRIMILYILLDDSFFILRLGTTSGTGSATKVISAIFKDKQLQAVKMILWVFTKSYNSGLNFSIVMAPMIELMLLEQNAKG